MSDVRINVAEEDDMTLLPIGIAAIVIGAIAGLILIALMVYMCCCRDGKRGGNWCDFGQTTKRKKRRVIVLKRRNSTRSQPATRRVAIRQPRPTVYTLPRNYPQRFVTPVHQHGMVQYNRRLLAIQPAPAPAPEPAPKPAPEPPKPVPKPTPVPDVCRCELPTASLQRGASLHLGTSGDGYGSSSVLSRGDTCHHHTMNALPMPPPPQPSQPAIFHQINQTHHAPTPPPQAPSMPIAFVNMSPNYQVSHNGGMGATFEINGVQGNNFQGYHSATYSHIPCDLPQTQSVIMEPYMVENSTADGGAVYIQEHGDSGSYHQYS